MYVKLCALLAVFGASIHLGFAQNLVEIPYTHQQTIQISAGTQGVGAEYQYQLASSFDFRIGGNLMPLGMGNAFRIPNFNANTKVTANFSNLHLLAQFTPFSNVKGIRLVTGAAYFFKASGGLEVQPTDSYKYGDIVLTQYNVGKLNMLAEWEGIAPYAGIGLIKAFPQHRFNINVDLGTYYLNKPSVAITGTGILQGNNSQSTQLAQNIKDYRWLPVLQLNFNFKL